MSFIGLVFSHSPCARQLVSHKHFLVNGIAVNIPSYTLKPGDTISVRDRSKKMDIILNSIRTIKGDIDSLLAGTR